MAYHISNGEISTGMILNGVSMYISSGGVANSTTVNSSGYMYISSGGVANSTTVNASGYMYISSGGVANSTTLNTWGSMFISSGGVANSTTLNSSGYMYISNGGVANSTTVNQYCRMHISSGGVANSTTVNSSGYMDIFSGGTAANIVANSGARLGITVASNTYIQGTSAGSAFEMKDAFISGYTLNSSGYMYISNGGVANSTTVNQYCRMDISSGGVANSTTVNLWGSMYISNGGVANSTTVNSSGWMLIASGGTATDITAQAGAYLGITVASDTYIQGTYNGSAFEMKDAFISGYTVNDDGRMDIYSGGVANSTTVNLWGSMYISNGGVANSTTVNDWGRMGIASGGVANSTTMSDGRMYISNGGVANNTTVDYYGAMYISSGGVANSTTMNGGAMYISSGGVANSTINSGGDMYISSGGVANNTTVDYYGSMWISSGGVANNTTVSNYGGMCISSGGVANSTTVNNGGWMTISSGGVANSTTINSGGRMYIYCGGVANSTTVNSSGFMRIFSGGTATDITAQAGARLYITVASDTYIQGTYNGSAFEMKDAFISGYTVNYLGHMYISSGGVANSTSLNDWYATMHIYSDGVANNTTVNSDGWMNISSGGMASSTIVNSGGKMYISSGGVHRGSLNIADGAIVSVYEGSIIDFTVVERTVADDYLINDLSLITGTPTYTITVSADQAFGTYKLAQGASAFTGTLSIGDGITSYGNITVNGENLTHNNIIFALNEYNGNLTLSVMQKGFTDIAEKMIFINSRYTEKVTGKKQSGVELAYGENAFISIADALKNYPDLCRKTLITVENKVEGGIYYNAGVVAGTAVLPVIKATDNSYSYKAKSTPRAVLTISRDTGSTEFIRFATVNLYGAKVNSITGGKLISNISKSSAEKNGTVTNTEKSTLTGNVAGKFTAINGSAGVVENYATVTLTGAEVATLSGGNTKETSSSKLVDGETKDQKTISTVNDSVAAGSVTLKNQAKADTISGYSNVTITDSTVGYVTNFTSKDSKSDTATYDEAKNTANRKVTLSHTETTAGTLKATNSTLGDVTGFATVTLKNVTEAGDFRRVDSNGNKYSTIKETLTVKTNKDGSVTGTYNKTETFTRAGKFTATGSTVGNIENFSNVTLDGSAAEAISNFVEAKIVTKYTATWENAAVYGRPDDYALNLQGWNKEKPVVTNPLNGSVTLKNGASAESITKFKSVTMTASEVVGTIENVEKVTVNKGDSTIGSYTGTDGNDTLSIAKGAVLTAEEIVLNDAKDTLALNGTLILTGSNFDVTKITGKGEIAVVDTLFDDVSVDFANLLNVGVTADNFRGTAYENADDTAKKAVKWDGKTEYNGWLGDWSGAKAGSDEVDYIKFKAAENAQLTVSGDVDWTLLDKKGNDIGKEITAAGEYTIKLNHEEGTSISYQIKLA